MINIGIDVGKTHCRAALKTEDGRLLGEFGFENTSQGVNSLLTAVQSHGGEAARAVVESTGNYWIRIHDTLEEHGVDTLLANTLKTKAIAQARIKNDKLDARVLADLLRGNLIYESYVPPKLQREHRVLVRHRASLVKTRTEIRNRLHALLAKHELRPEFSDLFGKAGVQWLESLQLPGADGVVLKTSLELLKALDVQIDGVTREIAREASCEEDVRLLMTLPGVDFYSALVIASEIGDIHRFSDQWKLVSYAGLAPRLHQSGSVERRGGITKQGSRWLRWVLVQAAQQARLHDSRFSAFYERVARRRGHNKAVVAVAKEMLVVVFFMLSRREPYRGANAVRASEKFKRMDRLAASGLQA